ncbi:hypothetical protein BC628DRAFT_1312690 [Trametes gibbosa]|nr:hypothetical protein BC628DRAFT_1312690 [Trametes gibbosa]
MPKATASSSTSSSSTPRSQGAPFQNAHVLRRNQACHQCRRRKLVSLPSSADAKRPCSTCIRSHSYAVSHAPPGADLPPHPECTFDESSEQASEPNPQDSPKNRFERLESRINELEALLQEKDHGERSRSRSASVNGFSAPPSLVAGYNDNMQLGVGSFSLNPQTELGLLPSISGLDELAGTTAFVDDMSHNFRHPGHSSFIDMMQQSLPDSPDVGFGMELLAAGWPRDLPGYPFLRHLVEAFFTFTPSASRMFHAPTFLASLSLPPTHPKFPLPATLHGMCALGSLYTAAVSPTPAPPLPVYCEITFSFAEMQIRAARESIEDTLRTTANLFGCLQAQVIVALWYWYNARWSEAYVSFALSLRYAVPCGLNACPPFESISSSNMTRSSIIPAASNVIDDETRRNTFWIAYIMERHFAAINNFAMMLDDEDISQMLPVRGDQFEQGVLVPPNQRQWSYEPNVIDNHLDDQLDPFILHVKAAMLLSKVKVFNGRYRTRRHMGAPDTQPDPAGIPGMPGNNLVQTSPAFVEIDSLLANFKQTLPTQFRDPMAHGVIDVNLFTALSTIHFGVIVLHEGHARIGRSACVSACRILAAARGILNLLYEAYSTSHNLALLGVFPMVCWFAAGRVLIRFLKAAIEAKSEDHMAALRTEVDFFRSVITGIGESVPHAHHYGKMLNDYLVQTCGKEYATVVAAPTLPYRPHTGPTPAQNDQLPTQFDDGPNCLALSAERSSSQSYS